MFTANLFKVTTLVHAAAPLNAQCQLRTATRLAKKARDIIQEHLAAPPTHSTTGYMLFYQEKFPQIKNQNPEAGSVIEIAKKLGAEWRSLQDVDKKLYTDRATKIHGEMLNNTEAFYSKLNYGQKTAFRTIVGRKSFMNDVDAGKDDAKFIFISTMPQPKYTQARHIFLAERLKSQKDVKTALVNASKEWGTLSAEQKAAYEKKAAQALKDYTKTLAQFIDKFEY